MKKIMGSVLTMVMVFALLATNVFAAGIQVVEDNVVKYDSEIIETEIIIGVTEDFDGTLSQELKDLGIISVENIFDIGETVMYVVKTDIAQENIISDLEELKYVIYAEYNQIATIAEESTMIALRAYEESLGHTVIWHGEISQITVKIQDEIIYTATLGEDFITFGDIVLELKAPLEAPNGTTYIEKDVLDVVHGDTMIFDFEADDNGFEAVYADYHGDGSGGFNMYEMKSEWVDVPTTNATKGMYIQSHNRSDDIFMGFVKEISNLTPNEVYTIKLQFDLATDVAPGMIGVGGSPGSSVFVKAGFSDEKPNVAEDETGMFRFTNLDIGSQSNGGEHLIHLGNVEKTSEDEGYAVKKYSDSFEVTANEEGKLYLVIGTDSGFEGLSQFYYDNIVITLL